jgi:hypothetical protein
MIAKTNVFFMSNTRLPLLYIELFLYSLFEQHHNRSRHYDSKKNSPRL